MKIITKNNSLIAIGLVLSMAFATDALAARGRVQVSNNTIKTDWGTLSRGARCYLDIWDETHSQSDIDAMKNRGLNAIHIYAEFPGSGQAGGYNSAKVDNVVNLADQNGLYVILTIGSGGDNGSYNSTFIQQFWNFYAPRYKDRTHVVYELCNEPVAWSSPYPQDALDMEKNTFNLIRWQAPNTHIMLMTYACPVNPTQAANECANLGISCGNASVAYHGYGIDGNENNALTSWYNAFTDKGIACGACTEPALSNDKANAASTQVFENKGVSYTHFINVHSIATDNSCFYDVMNNNGISWIPDYGSWPSPSTTGGTYKLIARHSGKALEAGGNSTANGTQIQQWDYVGSASQQWAITDTGNGNYKIIGVQSGKAVDIDYSQGGTANGTKVQLWDYWNGASQQFKFTATTNGYYRISPNCAPGSCLDLYYATTTNGAAVKLYQWSGGANQQWLLQPVDGTAKLISKYSGKSMCPYGGGTANGTQIHQWSYINSSYTDQQWTLTDTGSGNYKFINVKSGKALDISGGNSGNDTKVQLWDDYGNTAQLYKLTSTEVGQFRITPNCATGSCLDVSGPSTADGATVHLWQWLNAANQKWSVQAP